MEKRKPDDYENGDGDVGGKRAKMDPEVCGTLMFCGSTEWQYANKPGKLKEDFFHSKNNIYEPMRLAALKDVRIRYVGSGLEAGHCVVVDETGQVWTWGNNDHGQLGLGDTRCRRIPTLLPGMGPEGHTIVMVSLGARHTVLLTATGDVLTYGDNLDGQCGQGDMRTKKVGGKGAANQDIETCNIETVKTPEFVNYEGPPIVQVSAGSDFTMMLDVTGSVWTFGSQEFGQCGNGTDGGYNAANATVKMKYSGISTPHKIERAVEKDQKTKKFKAVTFGRVKSISAGSHHAAVADENGRVFTWGAGTYGRLGLGDTADAHTPQLLTSLDHPRGKVDTVYAGNLMTLMIGQLPGTMFMAGLIDHCKKEANMTPKPYFEIMDQSTGGLKQIGFWRKGFSVVSDEGEVIVCNTVSTYGELGLGERVRTEGKPKKHKDLSYTHILKVGTGSQHVIYVMRDTEEEDKEELEEFDVLDQKDIEYKE